MKNSFKDYKTYNKIHIKSILLNYIVEQKITIQVMLNDLKNYFYRTDSSFSTTTAAAAALPPLRAVNSKFEKFQIQRCANEKMRTEINPILYHIPTYTRKNANLCIRLKKSVLNNPIVTMLRLKPIIHNLWLNNEKTVYEPNVVFKNISFARYLSKLMRIAIKASQSLRVNFIRIPRKNSPCLGIDGKPESYSTTIKFSRYSYDPVNFNIQQRNKNTPITCDDLIMTDSIYPETDRDPIKINLYEVDYETGYIYHHIVYWVKNNSAIYKFSLNSEKKITIDCTKLDQQDAKYINTLNTRYDLFDINPAPLLPNSRICFSVLLFKQPYRFICNACISCICCLQFLPNSAKDRIFPRLNETIKSNEDLNDKFKPKRFNWHI